MDARGAMGGQLALRRALHRHADPLLLQPQQQRRAFEQAVEHLWEALDHGDDHGKGVDGARVALPSRVVELDTELRAVAVEPFGKFVHGRDVVVVAHGELGEGGRGAHVVHAADARDDEADAALRALLVIGHHLLRRAAVGLAEAHLRRGHDGAVFHRHGPDVHRAQEHVISHGAYPGSPPSPSQPSHRAPGGPRVRAL